MVTDPALKQLFGKWTTDPSDLASIRRYGRVTIEFLAAGRLIYTIHAEGKDEIVFFTYRVADGVLITDQPSDPREEHTRYSLTPDGKLVLQYETATSRYVKAD